MDGRRDVTRRRVVRTGTGLAVGGFLAGCTGGEDQTESPEERTDTTGSPVAETADTSVGETATPDESPAGTEAATTVGPTDGSVTTPATPYTATLAPAGEVAFEEEPQRVFTILSTHADMALALGRGENLNAVYAVEYTDSLMNAVTPRLDGVTVDWSDLYSSWNPSKERLYRLESDVHLTDPARVLTMGNWSQADVEEVRQEIAPWFGNTYSAQHGQPPDAYADEYEYYTLWEIFGRVSDAFRERDRYEALAEVRGNLLATIEQGLPPEDDRPSVAMILPSTTDESMWAYRLNAPGYHAAHTRPLGAVDAMAEAGVATGAQVDYESLVAADPDVVLILGGIVDAHDMPAIRETFADDPVASQVTAVQDGRIHAQATRHQGPIVNLFQLEMGAKQLYPDQFGEWPTYESGPYPDLSADERLFDHRRVADVITGDH